MTATAPDATRPDRASILGCAIDRVTMEQSVTRAEQAIGGSGFLQHMAMNAAKLVALQRDAELRDIVSDCGLVTADGQAVVWGSRILGDPLPERVAGIDLMHALLERAARRGYRVFILGARREILEEAVRRLRSRHPRLAIVGYRDGFFSESEDQAVAAQIRAVAPDMLFVAMPSPRKEYFLGRHCRDIGVPFIMGVGGSIDVVAGVTKRAPRLMQVAGLEWLFRLAQEPGRLLPRYLDTNVRFVALIARDLVRRRRARRSFCGS